MLLTGKQLEVTFAKQTVNAVHQMVLGCIGTLTVTLLRVRGDESSSCAESAALDLEMFAGHAKRKTITPDDVMLLARRSDAMVPHLPSRPS